MNHTKVHDWAQGAIDKYDSYVVHENLENAFGYLKGLRQNGNTDLELAVAEHYIFLRMCACWVGFSGVGLGGFALGAMAAVYDGQLKFIDTLVKRATGIGVVPRVGGTPTSPFSPLTVAWDVTGIMDGSEDCVFHWGHKKLNVPRTPLSL